MRTLSAVRAAANGQVRIELRAAAMKPQEKTTREKDRKMNKKEKPIKRQAKQIETHQVKDWRQDQEEVSLALRVRMWE